MWTPPWTSRSITSSSAFQRWFGNSVVRNPDGSPKIVYHGTQAAFTKFDPSRWGQTVNPRDVGFFLTTDPGEASYYATTDVYRTSLPASKRQGNVMPVYLSIQRPLVVHYDDPRWPEVPSEYDPDETYPAESPAEWYDHHGQDIAISARRDGYDGLVIVDTYGRLVTPGALYVVFDPHQIKSATGNRGTFDPNDPDILHGWR